MWNDVLLIEKIAMTQRVNVLLYYLQFIPYFGKKIPQHWFASIKFKQILAIVMFILSLCGSFLMKILYIFVIVVVPSNFLSKDTGGLWFCLVFIYVVISGFGGPFMYDTVTKPSKKDYVMIQLMRMDAKRYVHVNWVMTTLLEQTKMLVVLLFTLYHCDAPLWYAFAMVAISCVMRFCGNVYHLWMAQTRGKPFGGVYLVLLFPLFYGFAYGSCYLFKNDAYIIHVLITSCVLVVASCIFAVFYEKEIHYGTTMNVLMNLNKSFIDGTFQKETQKKDVEIRDSDISQQELNQGLYQNKKGYAYLNALFFQRHKRLFYKPMKRRIIGIVVIFALLDIAFLTFPDVIEVASSPLIFLPSMIFLLYAFSIGERVTRAMFYNCDVSLLHYGYYRQPDAIFINFKFRLKRIILLNGILATLLCVGFMTLFLCMRASFIGMDVLLFFLTIYAIAIFFSVHHLCLYYLLQPYTGELEMKSPIFGVVNGIVYFFSYLAMQIDGSVLFTILVLVATIAYSLIALFLVKKKAPETFHIR